LAAAHHDDGWAIWERRPDLDPATSQPVQFYDLEPAEHLPAYRAGIERAARLDPWTGLLVSMHGAGLYNDRYRSYRLEEIGEQRLTDQERLLVGEFLSDMAVLQQRLYTEAIGHRAVEPSAVEPSAVGQGALVGQGAPGDPSAPGEPHERPEVMDTYLLLQVWDRLSLQFALRHGVDGEIGPLPLVPAGSRAGAQHRRGALRCRSRGRFALALDPYPFAEDRVELPVLASVVPDRRYADPEDFLGALAAAGPTVLECTVMRE
jgi:hypothetical protein